MDTATPDNDITPTAGGDLDTAAPAPFDELPPPAADATLPPGGGTTAPTAPHEPTPPPSRRGAWHIAAIVVGALMLLPGVGTLTGGIALTVANQVATDDGYFEGTFDRVRSDGVAIAAVDLWDEAADDEDWPWILDWLDIDIRLQVDGAADTDEVFVGIARTADVERYLEAVAFSEVVDFDNRFPTYVQQDGITTVEPPTDQDFWTVSATGEGEQELTWEARNGRWSVVVMNADGSPDVAADVEVGLRSDAITPFGIVLIVVGGVMVLTAVVLLVVGIRGRRR